MYVAVKGGEKAIRAAHKHLKDLRRGDPAVPELSVEQIQEQLWQSVDRVMNEGSVYDPELAALAIKQAAGDLTEAVFLLRAYRTTLPKFGETLPLATSKMQVERRISATFKDLPGGQVLGPTYDYTHRLLDFTLLANGETECVCNDTDQAGEPKKVCDSAGTNCYPRVLEMLGAQSLVEGADDAVEVADRCNSQDARTENRQPSDITREPLQFPADRSARLQALARGDEGYLLALAYSTQRGYGRNHPFAGEIRSGEVEILIEREDLTEPVVIGVMHVTECEMVNQFSGNRELAPRFTRGYGLSFGRAERKTMSVALLDRALRARELGESIDAPAQDDEFVLAHCDNVESSGFVSHLKLPHYVDFQSELELLRRLQQEFRQQSASAATDSERQQQADRPDEVTG